MKNKTKIYRVASLLLVLCFISTVMISGTFAKYTSEFSGQDTALVARWDVEVTDGTEGGIFSISPDAPAELNLFSHAYTENIVSGAGTAKIIAPGVSGEFTLSVTNNSDVAAEVAFDFSVDDDSAEVPMVYKVKDSEGASWVDVGSLSAEIEALAPSSGEDTVTIEWKWPFYDSDTQDETDTVLGKASADVTNRTKYILTVTAKAEQIAPEEPEPEIES